LLIGFELLRESVGKIFAPEPPERSWVAVAVLAGSILCKLWLGLFNKTVGMRIDSAVMKATAADCLSDAISTGAVLLSTAVLLIFPNTTLNLDAYMGVIVAVLIMVAGIKILKEAKDSILGEAPSDEIVKQITDVVESTEGALGIHDLTVHNYGPGHVIAALHVEVDGHANVFETHDIVDNIEKRLRTECGIEATIHMDPIVTDDETVTSLREKSAEAVKAIDERLRIHDFRFVRGTTHSNLIFDVVAPFELKTTDAELLEQVAEEIRGIDPTYCTVVTVDRE
jgi:cation diffusion facilitator family transporter